MDPDATLKELLTAVETGDSTTVNDLADALVYWLDHAGFPPQTVGSGNLGQNWHATLTRSICRLARSHVETAAAKLADVGDEGAA